MAFLTLFLCGVVGGLLGGMGMGGGTVLIPILTMFCGVPQHLAQSVNLLSFLPMALLSLGVHFSNGLVDTKGVALMIVPAVLLSAVGSYCVKDLTGPFLRAAFGVFLCILSVWQAYQGIVQIREKRGDKARPAQR